MTIDLVEDLTRQLTAYFEFAGDISYKTYSFMTDYKEWPSVKGLDSETLNMITISVTLLLAKIVLYTVLVLENKSFLSLGVNFSELCLWYTSARVKNSTTGKKKALRTDSVDLAVGPNEQGINFRILKFSPTAMSA